VTLEQQIRENYLNSRRSRPRDNTEKPVNYRITFEIFQPGDAIYEFLMKDEPEPGSIWLERGGSKIELDGQVRFKGLDFSTTGGYRAYNDTMLQFVLEGDSNPINTMEKTVMSHEAPPDSIKSAYGLLLEAADTLKSRGKERDNPDGERSMLKAVQIFNAIHPEIGLTEVQGWRFMQCLKLSREVQGGFKEDDYLDGVGYAALKAECAIMENAREKEEG
jgi:hypothetical protein